MATPTHRILLLRRLQPPIRRWFMCLLFSFPSSSYISSHSQNLTLRLIVCILFALCAFLAPTKVEKEWAKSPRHAHSHTPHQRHTHTRDQHHWEIIHRTQFISFDAISTLLPLPLTTPPSSLSVCRDGSLGWKVSPSTTRRLNTSLEYH